MKITSRIHTESLEKRHAEELFAVIEKSRPHLLNLVWAESASLESTKEYIATPRGKRNVIFVNEKIAGIIETWTPDQDGFVTLGYWLGDEFRGYGIMQLVLKAVSDLIVAQAPVKAKCRSGNDKSRRMLLGAGFCRYGVLNGWEYFLRAQANWPLVPGQ